jgi:spore coat polysaccharide biosynthesis protein SpsF (cytidylyltransferase family)
MLQHELERLSKATKIDMCIVATSTKREDDIVEAIATAAGVRCFRGDEKDVLDRYYQAARSFGATLVVRATGDCPLQDSLVIDEVVNRFYETGADYTKQPENYPEGVDTEAFSFAALEASWREAKLPSEREHVTLFIRNHPERFKLDEWRNGNSDYSSMHWSVDTAPDFEFVTKIFEHFGDAEFNWKDVLALLKEQPQLLEINKGGTGFEGLAKSLKEDEEWKQKHG